MHERYNRNRGKFTDVEILAIRTRYINGETTTLIALDLGVCHQTIYNMTSGKCYRYAPWPTITPISSFASCHPIFKDYSLDQEGNVWSFRVNRKFGRKMIPHPDSHGYLTVIVRKPNSNQKYTRTVHRLVCETFHDMNPGAWACHKNGKKQDNRPNNLYWGDSQKNALDTIRHGTTTKGEKNCKAKLNIAKVRMIREAVGNGAKQIDMAHMYGVGKTAISDIVNRRTWKHVP